MGRVIPGCAETFMDSPVFGQGQGQGQSEGQGQGFRDMHQKVEHLRCGDTIATPAGVAQWVYNNGNEPLILVSAADIANNQNQLDRNLRVSINKKRNTRTISFYSLGVNTFSVCVVRRYIKVGTRIYLINRTFHNKNIISFYVGNYRTLKPIMNMVFGFVCVLTFVCNKQTLTNTL